MRCAGTESNASVSGTLEGGSDETRRGRSVARGPGDRRGAGRLAGRRRDLVGAVPGRLGAAGGLLLLSDRPRRRHGVLAPAPPGGFPPVVRLHAGAAMDLRRRQRPPAVVAGRRRLRPGSPPDAPGSPGSRCGRRSGRRHHRGHRDRDPLHPHGNRIAAPARRRGTNRLRGAGRPASVHRPRLVVLPGAARRLLPQGVAPARAFHPGRRLGAGRRGGRGARRRRHRNLPKTSGVRSGQPLAHGRLVRGSSRGVAGALFPRAPRRTRGYPHAGKPWPGHPPRGLRDPGRTGGPGGGVRPSRHGRGTGSGNRAGAVAYKADPRVAARPARPPRLAGDRGAPLLPPSNVRRVAGAPARSLEPDRAGGEEVIPAGVVFVDPGIRDVSDLDPDLRALTEPVGDLQGFTELQSPPEIEAVPTPVYAYAQQRRQDELLPREVRVDPGISVDPAVGVRQQADRRAQEPELLPDHQLDLPGGRSLARLVPVIEDTGPEVETVSVRTEDFDR